MPTPPTKPVKPGTIPAGVTHFQVYKLTRGEGTRPNGGKYKTWRGKRLDGDPDPRSGKVSHQWPLSELDAAKIRRRWGAGRYRVRYVTELGELLGSEDITLETPPGEVQGDALEAPEHDGGGGASSSPASRLRGMAGRTLDGGSMFEIMMLMQDSRDRGAERAAADAERAADRDRQFFAQLQAQQQQTIALLTGQNGGAAVVGGAGPRRVVGITRKGMARELKLLRRELALEQREELARIRDELLDQEPDDPPAKTAGEAAEKAGIAAVEGLGEHMPAVVGELLGGLRAWLKSKGQPTDAASMARAIQAVQAAAELEARQNGGGHGQDA